MLSRTNIGNQRFDGRHFAVQGCELELCLPTSASSSGDGLLVSALSAGSRVRSSARRRAPSLMTRFMLRAWMATA
ncbi:MAG: hypothetical protein H7293_02760 [Candidatus Saccharibacteria bacterium]|nr:hypothetical protein [Rhodoferax sp.]